MKKGQTESYSFLIGLIIAVLILTAIGCAVYNMYKPQAAPYFDKLTKLLKTLEKENRDVEEGEITFLLDKDKILLGFGQKQEYIGKAGFSAIFDWSCYGIKFAWGIYTPLGVTGKIDRPAQCPLEKSCLCLCNIKSTPYRITEDACKGDAIKCEVFDNLDFIGGKGCPQGVFVPGMKHEFIKGDFERGLSLLHYSKKGSIVSIDDEKPLSKEELEKKIKEKEQKVIKLQDYFKTKQKIYFIPVNWDKGPSEFDRTVKSHYDYTERKIKEAEEWVGTTFLNTLSEGFDIINLKDYQQCKIKDLNTKKMDVIRKELIGCLIKADPSLTKESLEEAKIIGLTDEKGFCGITDTAYTIVSDYKDPANTAHEWGHLMLFCDEYDHKEWLDMENLYKKYDLGCINPYPLCCRDNPYWKNNQEGYREYLENEKIGANCYPHYDSLPSKAKDRFKTKEEYDKYVSKQELCQGHTCMLGTRNYKYCRGIMGPGISCENINLVYDDLLDYAYLSYDKSEDIEENIEDADSWLF